MYSTVFMKHPHRFRTEKLHHHDGEGEGLCETWYGHNSINSEAAEHFEKLGELIMQEAKRTHILTEALIFSKQFIS